MRTTFIIIKERVLKYLEHIIIQIELEDIISNI